MSVPPCITKQRKVAEARRWTASTTLRALRWRCWFFFNKRCLGGFPWFWPAQPLGVPAMLAARRMVRWHFGRDHHPVHRALAQVLAAVVWPPAVLVDLYEILCHGRLQEASIRRIPGAFWAALRHNVLPSEYYAYALWQPERKVNIDNYLYSHEAARLFKVLNRRSEPDPIGDKLAFNELCKVHALPTPTVLAAFASTGYLLEFELVGPQSVICLSSHASGSPVRAPSDFVGVEALLKAIAAVA